MTLDEFQVLSATDRQSTLDWLTAHGLRYVKDFDVVGSEIVATIFSVDDLGKRYIAHRDGSRHTGLPSCCDPDDDDERSVAHETVRVPLQTPPPPFVMVPA